MKQLGLLVLFLLIGADAFSQSFYNNRRNRKMTITAGTGTASYYGELSNPTDYLDLSPNLALGLQYQIIPRIKVAGDLTWYRIFGSDVNANDSDLGFNGRRGRNLSFTSNNYELIGYVVVELFSTGDRYYDRPIVNPYLYAGFGVTYYNPVARLEQDYTVFGDVTVPAGRYNLRELRTEGVAYGRFAQVIPMGFGVRYRLTPYLNLALDGGYRITNTDFLDDASNVHFGSADPNAARAEFLEIGSADPAASVALSDRRWELDQFEDNYRIQPGAKRGNPTADDGYFIFNAKVEYYLPRVGSPGKRGGPSFNRRRGGGGFFNNLFKSNRRPARRRR